MTECQNEFLDRGAKLKRWHELHSAEGFVFHWQRERMTINKQPVHSYRQTSSSRQKMAEDGEMRVDCLAGFPTL